MHAADTLQTFEPIRLAFPKLPILGRAVSYISQPNPASHPSVVKVFEVGEQDGGLYIVMECLDGQPFSAVLEHGLRVDHATTNRWVVNSGWGAMSPTL